MFELCYLIGTKFVTFAILYEVDLKLATPTA